jgi:hypothetical protein
MELSPAAHDRSDHRATLWQAFLACHIIFIRTAPDPPGDHPELRLERAMRMRQVEPRLSLVALTNVDFLQIGQPGKSPWLGGIDIDDFGGDPRKAVKSFGASAFSPVHGFPQNGKVADPDYRPYITKAMVDEVLCRARTACTTARASQHRPVSRRSEVKIRGRGRCRAPAARWRWRAGPVRASRDSPCPGSRPRTAPRDGTGPGRPP